MSRLAKSKIGKLYKPVKIRIEAEKVTKDEWRIDYSEWLDIPEGETQNILKNTVGFFAELGIKAEVSENAISYTLRGSLTDVSNIIMGEFIFLASVGDLTLRDLLIMAVMKKPMVPIKYGGG